MSSCGTKRKCRNVRGISGTGVDQLGWPQSPLTQKRRSAFANPLIGAILVVTLGRTIFNDTGLIAGRSDR
jgi:hypothetical protein